MSADLGSGAECPRGVHACCCPGEAHVSQCIGIACLPRGLPTQAGAERHPFRSCSSIRFDSRPPSYPGKQDSSCHSFSGLLMLPTLAQCPNQDETAEAVTSDALAPPTLLLAAPGRSWPRAPQPSLEPWCPNRPQEESLQPRGSPRDSAQPRTAKLCLPNEFRTPGGDGFRITSALYTCRGEDSWDRRGVI